MSSSNAASAPDFESQHVHQVYSQIARHFSDTRYKPWPVVEQFLLTQPDGSLGGDFGCGNGKYINVNKKLFYVGTDRCQELLDIARQAKPTGSDFFAADNLYIPFRSGILDFALSIAVIHHFSTLERRISAVQEIVRSIRPGGKFLIFVWAIEQKGKRKFENQDAMVSWALPSRYSNEQTEGDEQSRVYHRFYHLFRQGELEELVLAACPTAKISLSGWDRDNWYIVGEKAVVGISN